MGAVTEDACVLIAIDPGFNASTAAEGEGGGVGARAGGAGVVATEEPIGSGDLGDGDCEEDGNKEDLVEHLLSRGT